MQSRVGGVTFEEGELLEQGLSTGFRGTSTSEMGLLELRVLWIGSWGRRLGRGMSEQEVSRGLAGSMRPLYQGRPALQGEGMLIMKAPVELHRGGKGSAGWGE